MALLPFAGGPPTGAALTKVDDTNVTLTLGGTPATALLKATSLTLGWSGQLAISRGGTALSTIASGSILAANSLDVLSAITSTSGLKVLKNNAGTISWNTTTGTGDSVMATAPTFVTNITTPIVYGSASASGNLLLQSTSDSTRGQVQIANAAQMYTNADTLTGSFVYAMKAYTGGLSVSTGAIGVLGIDSTATFTGNGAANGCANLFNAAFVIKDDGTSRTLNEAIIFAGQPTFTATVASGLAVSDLAGIPAITSLYHSPILNRTGAGTGTVATICGVYISGLASIGTGWTVTNWIGMLIDAPTVSGTLTNGYGIKNTVNAATNRWFLHSAGTAQNYLAGRLGIGIAVPLSLLHIEGASSGWIIQDEQDSNPTTTELDANDSIAIYNKANKLVFAYNNAGTITYLTIPLDGSTTTWTHGTGAP